MRIYVSVNDYRGTKCIIHNFQFPPTPSVEVTANLLEQTLVKFWSMVTL